MEEQKNIQMKQKQKREKGIALITLTVTIIVLILLVGVAIFVMTRQKGETLDTNNKPSGWSEKVSVYVDDRGNKVPVPDGFTVSKQANNVDEGLVIQDQDGNEFVWVPNGDLYEEIYNQGSGKYWESASDSEGEYKSKQYLYEGGTWTDNGGDLASVKKYGGFYVARYEAGLPSEIWTANDTKYKWTNGEEPGSLKGRRDQDSTGKEVQYKPVSKPNTPSWNRINQASAKKLAEGMYAGNSNVSSKLIDGYAWDTIGEWIKESGKAITDSTSYGNHLNSTISGNGFYANHKFKWESGKNEYTTYATNYQSGSYSATPREKAGEQTLIEIATGSSSATKTRNIYDLAGNMAEWTTETGTNSNGSTGISVCRGGGLDYDAESAPYCSRTASDAERRINGDCIGFRVVLYLK